MKIKLPKFTMLWLCFVLTMALAAPFVANEKPLFYKPSAHPAGYTDYRQQQIRGENPSEFFPFIPYSPGVADASNIGLHSPFEKYYYYTDGKQKSELPLRFHHWMGTDAIGADVAAGIVFGLRHSFLIALFSMFIALIIALIMGIVSGYYKLYGLRTSWTSLICIILWICVFWFYGYYTFNDEWSRFFSEGRFTFRFLITELVLIVLSIVSMYGLKKMLDLFSFGGKEIVLNTDRWVTTSTQLFISIPQLILIISLSALFKPSEFRLAIIFGILMWTDLSRVIRAEVIKMRQEGFIESCIASGLTTPQIIFRHVIPNLKNIIKPLLLYGIASVILTESGLSFIGLGVAPDTVTLGSLLAQAKENMNAWWLMLFPGMFLFITILCLFSLGKQNTRSS